MRAYANLLGLSAKFAIVGPWRGTLVWHNDKELVNDGLQGAYGGVCCTVEHVVVGACLL